MKEITALQHECKYFYLQVLLNFVQLILFSVQLTITIILYLHRESLMQCEAATSNLLQDRTTLYSSSM